MNVQITRIEASRPDHLGTPVLLANFDVESPDFTIRNCKLLERGAGDCFVVMPPGLKLLREGDLLRGQICEAALDALDEIERLTSQK